MTNDEVRAILGWADGEHDAYLTAVVPLLIEWAEAYTRQTWTADGAELPGGVKLFVAQAAAFGRRSPGVESERLGDYAVTFTTDLPASVVGHLRPYRRITFT